MKLSDYSLLVRADTSSNIEVYFLELRGKVLGASREKNLEKNVQHVVVKTREDFASANCRCLSEMRTKARNRRRNRRT